MRVLFMGTPDFAVPSLQVLLDNGYEVCAVYTQPDKPKGRGHRLQAPPVKELAQKYGIPVFQPKTLRTGDAVSNLAALKPDVIIVVAYGKILPLEVLELPRLGCINVHGSLLPKYRGAAPIQWAVLNGEKCSGVTTMFMGEGVDTGDILLQEQVLLDEEETAGELFDRLKEIGAQLLQKTMRRLEEGTLIRIPQKEEDATLAPMLSKDLACLDWKQPAEKLHTFIRGLNPWPSAYAVLDGKKMKLHASRRIPGWGGAPGELRNILGELAVACGGEEALLLTQLQPENSKKMDSRSYLLGHPLHQGAKFEELGNL